MTLSTDTDRYALAREALIEEGYEPTCRSCGRPRDATAWRTAYDLKTAVYADPQFVHGDSPMIGIALQDLIGEGIFEQNARLQVRLAVGRQP